MIGTGAGHADWISWLTEVEAVENSSLEYRICHGVVTNTGIKAGPYTRVIINGGKVVGKLGGINELLQGVLKGCEVVLIAAVVQGVLELGLSTLCD
jgi:hypothetical protein